MKKIIAALLCLMLVLSLAACGGQTQIDPDATAAEQAKSWIEQQMKANTLVSFTYGGAAYKEHISKWDKTIEETETGWTLTYVSPDQVELAITVEYKEDHAALEWVGQWTHRGSADSPVIGQIMMLDSEFAIDGAVMTTANTGGMDALTDYQPYSVDLAAEAEHGMKNAGGRSSQQAWPYFDLTSADQTHGIMGAIGWTGDWKCDFSYQNGMVTVTAGMQNTNYYMKAGETFRTPSMVIQFFKGDQDAGHNAWRQLVLDQYTPNDANGEPMRFAPITYNTWGGVGSDMLIMQMERLKKSGQYFEYQWIDAGWYGGYTSDDVYDGTYWWSELGNWYYNPGYDGVGFSELKAWHEENGTDFLIWFEPGRAVKTSQLYQDHPEFFLTTGDAVTYGFVDYGNPEALDYIIDMVTSFLEDMGSTFYRQDYNFEPANAWAMQDQAKEDANGNRVGVTEINYVTGHYKLLDSLLEIEGMQIDNCASGGRLLDIEMTKRSVPLWRTDYTSNNPKTSTASGVRSQGANLSWWLPISGGASSGEGLSSEYGFRSIMGSGVTCPLFSNQTYAKRMFDELLYNREMMMGDYYILQQGLGNETESVNAAYEYYLPDEGRGYVVAFRPTYSDEEYTVFRLKGLEAEATYLLENADTDETLEMTGEELMNGNWQLYFPRTQVAHMIYFTKQ